MGWRHGLGLIDRNLIIATDHDLQLGTDGPHAVNEVPGE
jgi:hypothetical protein